MNKISYLKGLLAGLEVNPESREGKIFYAVCEALEETAKYTEELESRVAELEELCDILDEDLGLVEEMLEDNACSCTSCGSQVLQYDYSEKADTKNNDAEKQESHAETDMMEISENSTEDFLEDGEEEYETICPTCGKCILLNEQMLEEGETVCPNCGEELEFDFDEEEIERLAPAEEE